MPSRTWGWHMAAKILIVENDFLVAESLARVMADYGFAVVGPVDCQATPGTDPLTTFKVDPAVMVVAVHPRSP
jgi:uncharacterized membrane protein